MTSFIFVQVLIIIDTNIVFSAILKPRSSFTKLLLTLDSQFFVCEYLIIEIFRRKEKLVKVSKLSELEIIEIYYSLLEKVNLYKENNIDINNIRLAYNLCKNIDENDTPHVALTLELQGLLWTGDKQLKNGLIQQGFTYFFDMDE